MMMMMTDKPVAATADNYVWAHLVDTVCSKNSHKLEMTVKFY